MTNEELNARLAASPSPDRITPEYLKSRIAEVEYIEPGDVSNYGTLTVCILTLDNGFQVIGKSACADPANYDEEIGRKIAYDNAEREIWPLLGFMLREVLHARENAPVPDLERDLVERAARLAHEANRAYCLSHGDTSQVAWEDAPPNIQDSARDGVRFILANPSAGPDASHNNWLAFKKADGWRYGPVKDTEAKTHPCFVEYRDLPPEQKAKDYLFRGIVKAVLGE